MKLSPMPTLFSGVNAFDDFKTIIKTMKEQNVFIVTGPTVSKMKPFTEIVDAFVAEGKTVNVFDKTTADPSIEMAIEVCKEAKLKNSDLVVGFGGGSPLDTAKIVAASLTNDVPIADFIGVDNIPEKCCKLIAIPTTSGTGSEVTNISVLTDTKEKMKKAVCSDAIVPDYVFLIPEMTVGMPKSITAATGMDALCHAMEACLSKKNNVYSDQMAMKAIELICANLVKAYNNPKDLDARSNMQLAAFFAGLAFNNSSVTAVHAFAYPLGGIYHIPHGMANALMLEEIMSFNANEALTRLCELSEIICGSKNVEQMICYIHKLKENLNIPMSLKEVGVTEDSLEAMAESVMGVKRLLDVNPVEIKYEDALNIYRKAF